jgi:hypothetical protein
MNASATDWEAVGRARWSMGRLEIRKTLEAAGLVINTGDYNRAREAFARGATAGQREHQAEREARERERIAPYMAEAREFVMEAAGEMEPDEIEAAVIEEATRLADEGDERAAEEAREAKRDAEELLEYQRQKACLRECLEAVEAACRSAGWRLTWRRCGNTSSSYYWLARLDEDGDEEEVFRLRISDHYAPNGSGWNEETQERHAEPDINIVIHRGADGEYTFDLAPLMETLNQ